MTDTNGLTNITTALEADARQEAKAIIQQAEDEFATLRKQAIDRATAEAEQIVNDAKREAATIYRSKVDSAAAANATAKANQQRELLNTVKSTVMQQLLDLPAKEYINMVVSTICNHAQDGDILIAGEDDSKVTDKLIEAIAQRFNKRITLSAERGTFSGGIIIKGSRKGKPFKQDFSFEGLFTRIKDAERDKILNMLLN